MLSQVGEGATVMPFSPYGYDERQLCSPGFNLPIGRLTRSVNVGYPEYHTSADDLDLIRPEFLERSLEACKRFVTVIEDNRSYENRSPKGEPRLGKRGLYGAVGGTSPAESEHAMLWVLNQSDGGNSLLDIAHRSGLPFELLCEAANALEEAGLLREAGVTASPSGRGRTAGTRNEARAERPRLRSKTGRKGGKK